MDYLIDRLEQDKEGPWIIYMANVCYKLQESDIEDFYKVPFSCRILKSTKSKYRLKVFSCSNLMILKTAEKF